METFKVSNEKKREIIQRYISAGLSQKDIAQLLGISKQLVSYWVNKIKGEEKKPQVRKVSRDAFD